MYDAKHPPGTPGTNKMKFAGGAGILESSTIDHALGGGGGGGIAAGGSEA